MAIISKIEKAKHKEKKKKSQIKKYKLKNQKISKTNLTFKRERIKIAKRIGAVKRERIETLHQLVHRGEIPKLFLETYLDFYWDELRSEGEIE